jgi:hypothetical protein
MSTDTIPDLLRVIRERIGAISPADLQAIRGALGLPPDPDPQRTLDWLRYDGFAAQRAEDNKPEKPKRLRCRASVLPRGEFRSRQCERAATGTADMYERGVRTPMAACTTHHKGLPTTYWSDDQYHGRVAEFMR